MLGLGLIAYCRLTMMCSFSYLRIRWKSEKISHNATWCKGSALASQSGGPVFESSRRLIFLKLFLVPLVSKFERISLCPMVSYLPSLLPLLFLVFFVFHFFSYVMGLVKFKTILLHIGLLPVVHLE